MLFQFILSTVRHLNVVNFGCSLVGFKSQSGCACFSVGSSLFEFGLGSGCLESFTESE